MMMMMRVIKTVAVLAIALLGRADAGVVVVKAPRTESPGLPSGHVFVEPVPTSTPTATILLPTISTTTNIAHAPGETPFDVNTDADAPMKDADSPETTSAPALELLDLDGQGQKFIQTTYWACATVLAETHCGWHEPILDTSAANMGVRGGSVALRAAGIVAFVAGALLIIL
ncbi:hypothetical protein F4823DRAFT_210654 [Ustulina deusta]|nr:hypothetical protein F4823DRAFT_210654 [Ustulina deusta]